MFIAMNRFRINKGSEAEFERIWARRDSHLEGVPGFEEFNLLRGPEADDHTLYASHSVWKINNILRTGQTLKPFARLMPMQAVPKICTKATQCLRVLKWYCKAAGIDRRRPSSACCQDQALRVTAQHQKLASNIGYLLPLR